MSSASTEQPGPRYAVVGATGAVGSVMVSILEERLPMVTELAMVASERSVGKTITFRGKPNAVQALSCFDFKQTDIALFSAGSDLSEEYAPKAAAAGCVVIDNTSCFRYQEDVPLVIPEINPEAIEHYHTRNIIANPNCSTIGMLLAVKPIHDAVGVHKINVATYQSVSGAGTAAVSALKMQSALALEGQPVDHLLDEQEKQIAFNALPHIGQFQDNGFTQEEMKMIWETRKILNADIEVNPTCVRVPVFCGHSAAVHLETNAPVSRAQAISLLQATPGVVVLDKWQKGGYPTAVTEGSGNDPVYVGRIRERLSEMPGLNFWVVSDNLRKGAALNSIQIAEKLTSLIQA